MTMPPPQGGPNTGAMLDSGRLWAGGLATAVVAALIAIVGILLARGVFDVPVLAPEGEGVWGDADTATYTVCSAFAAVVATGLLHLLLVTAPGPLRFFGWILALATVAAAVAPFAAAGSTSSKVATALINVALGLAIWMLLTGAARAATRGRRPGV
ncbi:DUF6069 family protein [Kribbella sp. CA-247076]|uniref:DUF6069 family protein n=1 Tax=Kribbella sp. CA-247076 TaxID=3239941 RepID=UPI003D8D4D3A